MTTHPFKSTLFDRGSRRTTEELPAISRPPDSGDGWAAASEPVGFSGACRATLTDWIQLVQFSRRDAVVKVEGHPGNEVTLWCRQGDIVDAVSDDRSGVEAVYQALAWEGGNVSIAFGPFEREHRIEVSTTSLLLEAACRRDSGVRPAVDPGHFAGIQPPATVEAAIDASVGTTAPGSARRPRRRSLALGLAGGVVILAMLTGAIWSWLVADRPPVLVEQAPGRGSWVGVDVQPLRDMARGDALDRAGAPVAGEASRGLPHPGWPSVERSEGDRGDRAIPDDLSAAVAASPVRQRKSQPTPASARRVAPANRRMSRPAPRGDRHDAPPAEGTKIRIIEARSPRVQLIEGDEGEPRIEGLE